MISERQNLIRIPGISGPLSLALPDKLAKLRQKALDIHNTNWAWWAQQLPMLEAEQAAWQEHTADEDWRLWRARRFVARSVGMELDIEPGELVVGRPCMGERDQAEETRARKLHEDIVEATSYAGGDTGHFHPNYETILTLGVGGLLDKIARLRSQHEGDADKQTFYDSCRVAMEGFGVYIRRVADECDGLGDDNSRELAAMCRRLAVDAPQTFHEACQMMFMVMVVSWFCEDHVMTCYGRMDRTLERFYDADIAAGRLTPQRAMEIISSMYIGLNRVCPVNLADGVIVGGRDGNGRDVTNTLSYLCLAARWATWLSYPALAIAWHENTPDELMQFALVMLSSGINDPAFFNDEVIPAGLQDHGVSVEDSHNFMNSTCVEIKTVGNSNIWVATRYFNCPGALLEAIRAEAEGECAPAADVDGLQARTKEIIARQVRETAEALVGGWAHRTEHGCMPFASCIIDDCLARGLDHDRGGCRYHWVENSFVGLANLADSLVTIDELVFRTGELTMAELYKICVDNFEGHEPLRQRILNELPSYGNDDDRPDHFAVAWADYVCELTESCMIGGHRYVPGFFCHMNHGWLGAETGATPDGRLAGLALADGAGAAQGREAAGPTASVLSTTKWSHRKALGGLVHNVRFSSKAFETPADRQAVRSVIETYLRRGGFEIQLNVVSADTLRDAKERPEEYRDLVVRVAGYSDYFNTLTPQLQDEIIARTEFSQA